MYYVEQLDLLNPENGFTPVESSWEFDNPSVNLKYACVVARNLAIKFDGERQFRVVGQPWGNVWANYVIIKQLISTIQDKTDITPISANGIDNEIDKLEN